MAQGILEGEGSTALARKQFHLGDVEFVAQFSYEASSIISTKLDIGHLQLKDGSALILCRICPNVQTLKVHRSLFCITILEIQSSTVRYSKSCYNKSCYGGAVVWFGRQCEP